MKGVFCTREKVERENKKLWQNCVAILYSMK